jgi:hypothetical protein
MSFLDSLKDFVPFASPAAGLASATYNSIKKDAHDLLAPDAKADAKADATSSGAASPTKRQLSTLVGVAVRQPWRVDRVATAMGCELGHIERARIMKTADLLRDSSMGAASGPSQSEWVALTAVAATQPQKLPALMKQEGITLTPTQMKQLQVAAARAKIIMSHPAYKQIKLNKAALSKLAGDGESTNMGFSLGILGKILTAPLAAGAVAASALTWGVNHLVTAPIHAIGSLNNWAAKKGGWGNMPGYGSSTPTPAAPGVVPSQYMPPLPPGLDPATAAALQQRKIAAYQAQAAAQAQSDAAQQQLAASAAADNAEADALEAQNQAQADQDAALQAQYGIAPQGDGSDQMGGRSRADRTLSLLVGMDRARRNRARTAAMGAWVPRRGGGRPVLVVGGRRVAYDSLGRASILD